MTEEEIARFALMLREADKVRAMIAEDEAAEAETLNDDSIPEVPLEIAA